MPKKKKKLRSKSTSMVAQILRICQFRGHKFVLWSGMTPHAEEQLNPCSAASEPTLSGAHIWQLLSPHLAVLKPHALGPMLCKNRSPHNEGPTDSTRESPLLDTTEKNYVQQ